MPRAKTQRAAGQDAQGVAPEPAQAAAAPEAITPVEPERLADERWYAERLALIAAKFDAGQIKPLAAKQAREFYTGLYEEVTGQKLSEGAKALRSPLERMEDERILELNEKDVDAVEASIEALPGLSPEKKGRWLRLIGRVRKLQHKARQSAEAMWVYVGRDSETGDVFRMADIHHRFFGVWADESHRNSIIEAPPDMGKTTCFRGQKVWDVAQDQTLRCLVLLDNDDKAKKEIDVLKRAFRCGRFRALYPDIRVLSREDGSEDSRKRFTVTRPNWGSREPTFEAAGITSQINGNGYDVLYIDDPCTPEVVNRPSVRKDITFKFDNEVEMRLREPKRARIRMICTPWHPQDLAGHLTTQITEGKRSGWKVAIDEFAVPDDEDGQPISPWPERYDSRYFAQQRARKTTGDYARLYRLRCLPEEERIVSRLHYYPADRDGPDWRYLSAAQRQKYSERLDSIAKAEQWLSVDPSATSGKASSEVAIVQFALTARGLAHVVDCWFFPGNPVHVQEWLLAAISGEVPEGKRWRIPHRVDKVLFEAQGGMTGQVTLWENFLLRELRRHGKNFTGKLLRKGTRDLKGQGQNVGKRIRLKNAAAYLENGFVSFPGRVQYVHGAHKVRWAPSARDNIQKLVGQIVNFPTGPNDGVDAVTQWISFNEPRLMSEAGIPPPAVQSTDSARQEAVKKRFKSLHAQTGVEDEFEKEMRWLTRRSAVA